jgi:two-component system repressor protein LuxO
MDLQLQTKLLRFLQTGTIQPVGSPMSARWISALCAPPTGPRRQKLPKAGSAKTCSSACTCLPVALKPLRARGDDVIELAQDFVAQFAREERKQFTSLGDCAVDRLRSHHWPGNVRELQNVIRQAIVLHDGTMLKADMLPDYLGMPPSHDTQTSSAMLDGRLLWQIERDVIEAAISRFAGSIPKAADALGISPSTIYRKRENWAAMPA